MYSNRERERERKENIKGTQRKYGGMYMCMCRGLKRGTGGGVDGGVRGLF